VRPGSTPLDGAEEVEAERLLALVPWADTLNHCSTATERSVLQYDASEDAAVLFAHRDYQEGEEVFDSYGPWLTPSELLLDYGFVDEKNTMSAITV
jgi:SET domain